MSLMLFYEVKKKLPRSLVVIHAGGLADRRIFYEFLLHQSKLVITIQEL